MASLTPDETRHFHEQGYLGPYRAFDESEAASIRRAVEEDLASRPDETDYRRMQSRHLDSSVIFEAITGPEIVDRVSSLIGPDVVLWRSHMFDKPPGDAREIPWHQDYKFWPIEPPLNVSAWVALTPATQENGCVQIIPGSHLDVVPHVESIPGQRLNLRAQPESFDADRAVDIELRPGEFFLFVERLLHHSGPNQSSGRRLGIATRFTVPFVRVDHDQLFPGHYAILLRGTDVHGFNRYGPPPQAVASSSPASAG